MLSVRVNPKASLNLSHYLDQALGRGGAPFGSMCVNRTVSNPGMFVGAMSAALLICMGSAPDFAYAAFRKDASISVEAEHNSNVALTADETSNQAYRFGGKLALTQDSARFSTNVNLSLTREFNSDADDRTLPVGNLNSQWTIAQKRLFWVLNDTVSVALSSPLSVSTIDESEVTNVVSTGPDWIIPFSAFTNLRFSGRYERTDYESEGRADRPRKNASVTLSHVINAHWTTDLSHQAVWEEFDDNEVKLSTNQLGLGFQGKRINWRAAVGETEYEGNAFSSDVVNFNFRYRINSALSLFGTYAEALESDIGRTLAFAQRRAQDLGALVDRCLDPAAATLDGCDTLPGFGGDNEGLFLTNSNFQFDNALFETEEQSVGLQLALNRVNFLLEYLESEERQSIDASTGGLLNESDVLRSETARLSIKFPVTARLQASVLYELRNPEAQVVSVADGRVITDDSLEETRVSFEMRWSVEPMLSAFFRAVHTEVTQTPGAGNTLTQILEADGERYAIGFEYNFQ